MSAADKSKLEGIATNANNYSLPDASTSQKGGVKIGSNISVSSGTISLTKDNVTSALGYTPGTGSGSVTGVKGNSESSYRTGNVNLTAANVGAAESNHTHSNYAASSHNHDASNITSGTLPVARGGTGNTTGAVSYFVPKNLGAVNFDELKTSGFYYVGVNSLSFVPNLNTLIVGLLVFQTNPNNSNCTQILFFNSTTANGRYLCYMRGYGDGGNSTAHWTSWQEVYNVTY